MSRSFKHTPIYKSGASSTEKRGYNKATRQYLKNINYEIGNGSNYKTIVNSYNYHDYKEYSPNPTDYNDIDNWSKYCYRK
jgi:hypothetical protein